MAKAKKNVARDQTVKLSVKGDNAKTTVLKIPHALRLLKMKNSQWIINDTKFEFDGNEIKRQSSKTTDSIAEE